MASTESSWIVLLFAFITTIPDETMANANLSQVSPLREKCQNVYNSNNFYAGPNKKVETLLHEVKKELKEIQKDISHLKGNRTSVEGKYQIADHGCISIFQKLFAKFGLISTVYFGKDLPLRRFHCYSGMKNSFPRYDYIRIARKRGCKVQRKSVIYSIS